MKDAFDGLTSKLDKAEERAWQYINRNFKTGKAENKDWGGKKKKKKKTEEKRIPKDCKTTVKGVMWYTHSGNTRRRKKERKEQRKYLKN